MNSIKVNRAKGDYLYDENDTAYFDLISGFGTVFLGHCHPDIVKVANQQIEKAWSIARFDSFVRENAYSLIQSILPKTLRLSSVNSTGMESSEYAARYAAAKTGKQKFIGFSNCMHGKSALTANMTWANTLIKNENTHILEFPSAETEHKVLSELEDCLKTQLIAGCFIEPVRGSFDGSAMSETFMEHVIHLCKRYHCLTIFDETLTGLYRTGSAFVASNLAVSPDVLIFAKLIGNGFPISCVASDHDKHVIAKCLPGSTFSENPIALSIAAKVIEVLKSTNIAQKVAQIESTIASYESSFAGRNIQLKGQGALWVLRFESHECASLVTNTLFKEQIVCSQFGNNIRLLPKLYGDINELKRACEIIAHAC